MSLNWLFPQYQQNLLRVLYENPSSALHISELARRANIDSGNAKRYLEKFADQKLVTLNKTSKMTFVHPDFSSREITKVFEMYEVDRCQSFLGRNQPSCRNLPALVESIVSGIDGVQLVSLFGPCTHTDEIGRSTFTSRLDLVVVIANGTHSENLDDAVNRIAKEVFPPEQISPLVVDAKDFRTGWKKHEPFYRDLWRERIVLQGESYFWKLVANLGVPE
jgi:hypothetical protein